MENPEILAQSAGPHNASIEPAKIGPNFSFCFKCVCVVLFMTAAYLLQGGFLGAILRDTKTYLRKSKKPHKKL